MEDPEIPIETNTKDLIQMVKGLSLAFPEVKYIAINANISTMNEDNWNNEWYAVGFTEKPWLTYINGYRAWANEAKVTDGSQEDGVFFCHFSSEGYHVNGIPLQTSTEEFMDEEDLCFNVENESVEKWFDPEYVSNFDTEEETDEA